MTSTDALRKGREAFLKQAWAKAYELLSSADHADPLPAEDLECLAKAAYLIGKTAESNELWSRAYHEYLNDCDNPKAVNCAFWLGMILFNQGDVAQGSGWMARANRLADRCPECAEQGLLLVAQALQHLRKGDGKSAQQLFGEVMMIGDRFNDPDIVTLGQLGCGQALILQNRISEGRTLLDEAMVAVVSDETSPIVAGLVYCAVIETCRGIYDLRRAKEWTSALSRWCGSHPDLVPYRGQCLVRRAEIMQIQGEWPKAIMEIKQACKILTDPPGERAAGEAFYRQGELHRLRGDFTKAMEMYRKASNWGRKPQPGLALMRLMQGQTDVAKAAISQFEKEKKDPIARSAVLPAYVEIMLAADEPNHARRAAFELSEIASQFRSSYLEAVACYTEGGLLLATDEMHPALDKLQKAWSLFNKVEAIYESARTRVLIGRASRKLGDRDTADMEFDAARHIFDQLGAAPDLNHLDTLKSHFPVDAYGLTPRELEVLRYLATGKTNKEIASELMISERTVDRHVSNILGKFNVSSRSAATAYAYEHQLI